MIVVMNKNYTSEDIDKVVNYIKGKNLGVNISMGEHKCVIGILGDTTEANIEEIQALRCVSKILKVQEPYKKANRLFHPEDTIVNVNGNKIGGKNLGIIAGPCAVESEEQIVEIAKRVKASGANFLRGGAFKPRTSPYSFQGLELDGLKLMEIAKQETGLPIVTELMGVEYLDRFVEDVDVIQIGARNMQNFDLLKAVGKTKKPILLKRGMSATIQEWIMAAEYIMSEGNPNVIFCERGIRTFETYTRNTLDLSVVPIIKERTHLPIIIDPSHAAGDYKLIESLSLAAIAAGADGLIIEVYDDPENAWSDGAQSLKPKRYADLVQKGKAIAKVIGREL